MDYWAIKLTGTHHTVTSLTKQYWERLSVESRPLSCQILLNIWHHQYFCFGFFVFNKLFRSRYFILVTSFFHPPKTLYFFCAINPHSMAKDQHRLTNQSQSEGGAIKGSLLPYTTRPRHTRWGHALDPSQSVLPSGELPFLPPILLLQLLAGGCPGIHWTPCWASPDHWSCRKLSRFSSGFIFKQSLPTTQAIMCNFI